MLQYYPPICDLDISVSLKLTATSKIDLSLMNFEIVNAYKIDNSEHEFWHITSCYSIIQQRFKYQFGQRFVVLTTFTS